MATTSATIQERRCIEDGEYIMNSVDLFMWIVIGGSIAIVFVMFLWSIDALAKMMKIGRKILRRKHKRKHKAAGHNRAPKAAGDHRTADGSSQREDDNHETQNKVRTQIKCHR